MANLPEPDDFPAGIYQLEDTDPVKGGAPNEATGDGMDNIPHAQLARRTRWLRTRVDQLMGDVSNLMSTIASLVPNSRTISAAGLATGGGPLNQNRTITVTDASQPEAEAGLVTNRAMSPLRVAQHVTRRFTTDQALTRTAGRQVLPGGLIMTWTRAEAIGANGADGTVVPLPFPYPNQILHLQICDVGFAARTMAIAAEGTTHARIWARDGVTGSYVVATGWILAIGY